MGPSSRKTAGLSLFYSYSHVDEALRQQLETHLALLRRRGVVREWHDRKLLPGSLIDESIARALEEADVILLLVSSDFLASDYCYDREMARALERHRIGAAVVIPIMLRPVDFQDSPFAGLLALPTDAKPITTWSDRDEAWLNVSRGIRNVCENIGDLRSTVDRTGSVASEDAELPALEEDDFGLLDFSAELETAMAVSSECITTMTSHAEELGQRLNSGKEQSLELSAASFPNKATRARQIATVMAGAIASYAKKMENTRGELGEAWSRVDRFFPKLLANNALATETQEAVDLRNTIVGAGEIFKTARDSTLEAKDSMRQLGQLSAALKVGTNRAQKALQGIADQFWRMEQSVQQMLLLLDDAIECDNV